MLRYLHVARVSCDARAETCQLSAQIAQISFALCWVAGWPQAALQTPLLSCLLTYAPVLPRARLVDISIVCSVVSCLRKTNQVQ